MKNLLIIGLLSISSTAFAFQTPLQESLNAINAVSTAITSDNQEVKRIKKIILSDNTAVVEMDNGSFDHFCSTYTFRLSADNQGQVSAKLIQKSRSCGRSSSEDEQDKASEASAPEPRAVGDAR